MKIITAQEALEQTNANIMAQREHLLGLPDVQQWFEHLGNAIERAMKDREMSVAIRLNAKDIYGITYQEASQIEYFIWRFLQDDKGYVVSRTGDGRLRVSWETSKP